MVLEAEKQLVSKAARLVCTGRIVPAICVCKYQKGAGGVVGCLPSAAVAPHPHPQASEGAGLANKATTTRSPSGSGSAESLGKLATAGVALVRQWPWPLEASQPGGTGVGFPWRGGSCQKIKWKDSSLWDLKRDTLLRRGSPVLGESPEWLFCISPGARTSTHRREPSRCIEGAFEAPFIMSTKVMSFKSYLKSAFARFPVPLVVLIESKYP